jgi:hypothetical protein
MPDHSPPEDAGRDAVRAVLGLVTAVTWAATLIAVLALLPYPAGALIPLLVLVAGLEGLRGLEPDRGAGGLRRFLPIYWAALAVNLLAVWAPGPIAMELATLGGAHAVAAAWGLVAGSRGPR